MHARTHARTYAQTFALSLLRARSLSLRYPLAPVQDLAHDKPNKLTLLGMDLVIWLHAPSDRWRVFADVCPHRLVPLSEGRVEPNGVLQCAYHGWEFGVDGQCVRIPQMGRTLCEDSPSVRSERACATSFPAQAGAKP